MDTYTCANIYRNILTKKPAAPKVMMGGQQITVYGFNMGFLGCWGNDGVCETTTVTGPCEEVLQPPEPELEEPDISVELWMLQSISNLK